MANRIHDIKGLPNDILTNEVYNERRLKVDSVNANDADPDSVLAHLLSEISSTNKEILTQLTLLNARIEEAFNTKIGEIDIE